jgi:hypothetical protein
MKNSEILKNYLQESNIYFEEKLGDDGSPLFIFRQSVKNGETLLIGFAFDPNQSTLDIKIFNIATIESSLKREELLKFINDLNEKYRFGKYMVNKEGQIYMSHALVTSEGFSAKDTLAICAMMVQTIEDEYPKFMKLRWA